MPFLAVALAGCTAPSDVPSAGAGSSTPGEQGTSTRPAPRPVTFTVVGDSITAGRVPDGVTVADSGSWVPAAAGGSLQFVPGWAVSGATTEDMRAGVVPVSADVVVIMGGTNDLQKVSAETTAADVLAIAQTVRAGQVVLAAIPPNDTAPTLATALNRRLGQLADQQGWVFVDPWTPVADQGRYVPGASADGVHPTVEVAEGVGRRIRAELLDLP
ncbi:SGNH/GDSL hydrolase family protein [Klenkia terrae]|uniref:SGNH/GDSL hydrolase family protein n=1 Tax=Klenkia terrae TaxID=1052259 RepID=UPI0036244A33